MNQPGKKVEVTMVELKLGYTMSRSQMEIKEAYFVLIAKDCRKIHPGRREQ